MTNPSPITLDRAKIEAIKAGTGRVFTDDLHALCDLALEALSRAAPSGSGEWRDIASAPKNQKVLAAYRNVLGNWRVVTACYHTHLPWSDDEEGLHEAEYAPEGWYEESDSSETIYRTSSVPTHWMPLPAPPATQPQGAENGK